MKRLLCGVFFASGAAALLDEIIWRRLLVLLTGTGGQSIALVAGAFMAGIGVGSVAGGYAADRLHRRGRILAFACSELAIAVFALASANIFYDRLYRGLGALPLSELAVGALSFAVLLWPTFFMGMSLPLLTRLLTDDAARPAEWVPALYGWNTVGSATGALFAVMVVFRVMDMRNALRLSAAISAACAVTAWAIRHRFPSRHDGATPPTRAIPIEAPDRNRFGVATWLLLYSVSGYIALSLEIVWVRLLGVMIKSTAFTFGLVLAIYLTGIGLGALLSTHRRVRRLAATPATFIVLQAGAALYAVAALAFLVASAGRLVLAQPLWNYLAEDNQIGFDALRALALRLTGAGVDLPIAHPLALLVILYGVLPVYLIGPSTVMIGMSFGFLQRAAQRDLNSLGRRLGWLQAANIAGSVFGTLFTSLYLMRSLGSAAVLRVVAGLGGILLVSVTLRQAPRRWSRLTVAIVAAALAVGLVPSSATLWGALHGAPPREMLAAEDSVGVAAIRPLSNGFALVSANGIGQSVLPYGSIRSVLGALPALVHPAPVAVAVVGLGSGDTVFNIGLRRETQTIDCVEVLGAELPLLQVWAGRHRDAGLLSLLRDARVHYSFADGRLFLMKTTARYDIIEADAIPPDGAFAGNLYSVEYFDLLRRHLNPGGLAASWEPTARVRRTFVKTFPYVLNIGGVLLGSNDPLTFNPAAIRRRLSDAFTRTRYADAHLDIGKELAMYLDATPVSYGPDFDRSALDDVNSDLFPKDEFLVPRPSDAVSNK